MGQAAQVFCSSDMSVADYRCTLGPGDQSFPEVHKSFSLAYVRKGSFGCHTQGRQFELVAGSILIGRPGDEYVCSHDHHVCGDECLSFQFAPDLADALGATKAWRAGALPPLAPLIVVGELAQTVLEQKSNVGPDEAGMILAAKFAATAGEARAAEELTARDRRRAVEAALWIGEHAHEPVDLAKTARFADLSPFHFLRCFAKTLGVTPHQYLVRCRIKRAARLLADRERAITDVAFDCGFNDLSNFIRTFGRAAGMSPRTFRNAATGNRKKVQERLAAFA
ncbi:MAG: helix-turn-helix transcriptional regulator [Methylobacteriaceae bacterium]|nr:helix-turn-helix transcriptional regulator [Methylobacteriaceae bacterium]